MVVGQVGLELCRPVEVVRIGPARCPPCRRSWPAPRRSPSGRRTADRRGRSRWSHRRPAPGAGRTVGWRSSSGNVVVVVDGAFGPGAGGGFGCWTGRAVMAATVGPPPGARSSTSSTRRTTVDNPDRGSPWRSVPPRRARPSGGCRRATPGRPAAGWARRTGARRRSTRTRWPPPGATGWWPVLGDRAGVPRRRPRTTRRRRRGPGPRSPWSPRRLRCPRSPRARLPDGTIRRSGTTGTRRGRCVRHQGHRVRSAHLTTTFVPRTPHPAVPGPGPARSRSGHHCDTGPIDRDRRPWGGPVVPVAIPSDACRPAAGMG